MQMDKVKLALGAGPQNEQPETTGKKICRAYCSLQALVYSVVFCLMYGSLSMKATQYNDQFPNSSIVPYDSCSSFQACLKLDDPTWAFDFDMLMDLDVDADVDVDVDVSLDAPDLSAPTVPDLSAPTVPDLSAPTVPDLSAPTIPDPSVPDVNLPEVPELPEIEFLPPRIGADLTAWCDQLMGGRVNPEQLTDWTMIYNFNFLFGIILIVQSLLALLAVCVKPLRGLVGFCNCCCTGIVNLVMCIMTVVYAFDQVGYNCYRTDENYFGADAPEPYNTYNFHTDAAFLRTISVWALCLWIVFCCSNCCAVGSSAPKQ